MAGGLGGGGGGGVITIVSLSERPSLIGIRVQYFCNS